MFLLALSQKAWIGSRHCLNQTRLRKRTSLLLYLVLTLLPSRYSWFLPVFFPVQVVKTEFTVHTKKKSTNLCCRDAWRYSMRYMHMNRPQKPGIRMPTNVHCRPQCHLHRQERLQNLHGWPLTDLHRWCMFLPRHQQDACALRRKRNLHESEKNHVS